MAESYVQIPANGSTAVFTIPFDYLDTKHVTALVDGTQATFTWLSAYSVTLDVTPTSGSLVWLLRSTPRNKPLVDFTNGSVLVESDLDRSSLQSLYIAQEAYDALDSSLHINIDGVFDAVGLRVTQLAEPQDAQDAVTLQYLTSNFEEPLATALSNINSLTAAAVVSSTDASFASAEDAEDAAASAATSANAAQTSADAVFAALDGFDDRYLGSLASDPTTDNDGDALVSGTLYFNTVDEVMRNYTGSGWVTAYISGDTLLSLTGGTMAGQLNMAGHALVGLPAPGLGNSAATKDYVDASSMSASEILTALKTVDSNNSGLNANKLQGFTANSFAKLSSPTFTGSPKGPTPTTGTGLANKDYVDDALSALPSNVPYSTPEQTILSDTAFTFAHGLGRVPTHVQAWLVCQSAERGYSIGNRLAVEPHYNAMGGTAHKGQSIVVDAANVNVQYGDSANVYRIMEWGTRTYNDITNSKWKLVVSVT